MPPNSESQTLPESVGRYRIVGEVDRGGMGVVLRARDPRLHRDVALKLLPPSLVADALARTRFEREARAASALDHPAICTIYEIADGDDGEAYIAMAYYEGTTLSERIRGEPLPVPEAVEIARQIADGLARAHEEDIVHRDIKPGNVMITSRGQVKILDFGVAKLAGEARLTDTGVSVGTLQYMAPEQASADPVDSRADLWAVGVLIYEMLTGASPFQRDTPAATMGAVLGVDPEPLDVLRTDAPAELVQLVFRLLNRDPRDRPASAREVADRLAEVQAPPGSPAAGGGADPASTGRLPRGIRRPVVAGVLLLLVAAAAWWWSRTAEVRWARQEAIPEVLRLVGENRSAEAAALALRAEAVLGPVPLLEPIWPRVTTPIRIRTDPAGADVSARPYSDSASEWASLGRSPLELERLPVAPTRFRIEREGYEPVELVRSFISANQQTEIAHAGYDYQNDASYAIDITLTRAGELPEGMVRVAGGLYGTVPLLGFSQLSPRMIPEYHIDRTEVTHGAFADFVADGGYDDHPVVGSGPLRARTPALPRPGGDAVRRRHWAAWARDLGAGRAAGGDG